MNKEYKQYLIQALLFIITFFTTTLCGAEWVYGRSLLMEDYSWNDFLLGMEFSVPFLLILTVHEFGHYFTARFHRVKATLPYYLPLPPGFIMPSIGTLGAVIRIKDRVRTNVQHFDIGLAGPLAGFVVALLILIYGFITLPPAEHIYSFHPEYKSFGLQYADHVYTKEYLAEHKVLDMQFGSNLLFELLKLLVDDPARIPNPHELMHYPLLMAGFIALFFTSMNLLPIGQLDGGHVTYGLFGYKGHEQIATVFFLLLLFYSGLGMVTPYDKESLMWSVPLTIGFYYLCMGALQVAVLNRIMFALLLFAFQFLLAWVFPSLTGYSGWLLFGFVVSRFVGIQHPPSEIEVPLDNTRIVLGWITLLIFILCFSPAPIMIS